MLTYDSSSFWLTCGDPGPLPEQFFEPAVGTCCVGDADRGEGPRHGARADAGSDGASRLTVAELPPADSAFWNVPGAAPLAPAASRLLLDLISALDAVSAHGPLSGSRADTAALLQQAERARGLALRELAEMDATGGHLRPGVASTTASWLRGQQRLSDGAARSAVALSVALRDDLPAVGALLLEGTITQEHAGAVRDGVRGLDHDVVHAAQEGLCALAQATDPADVRKRLRDKAAAIDDRIAAEAERRARERMGLRLTEVGSHTAVDGTLAGDDGATVRLAMALAVEAARTDGETRGRAARQADVLVTWANAFLAREHGPGDSLADDAHTVRTHLHILCRPDQLPDPAVDSAVDNAVSPIATHPARDTTASDSATNDAAAYGNPEHPAGARGASPLSDLLRADLTGAPPVAAAVAGDSAPLSRGALRRLACDATVSLCLLPDRSGGTDPLYVGRSTRTVSGAQFRALVARDRHCVVNGCRRAPAQCAAHHVRHWADGGATDLPNLVLLCHQHHHDHHDRGQDLPHHDRLRRLTPHGWAAARSWERDRSAEPPPF